MVARLQHTWPDGLGPVLVCFAAPLEESYFGFLASELKGSLLIWLTFNFLFGLQKEKTWPVCD